jgi:hypothetical protein
MVLADEKKAKTIAAFHKRAVKQTIEQRWFPIYRFVCISYRPSNQQMMTMMGSGSRTFQPFYLKKG